MKNNELNTAQILAYDETNYKGGGVLQVIGKLCLKIFIIFLTVYLITYSSVSYVLSSLTIQNQQKLESFLASGIKLEEEYKVIQNELPNEIAHKIVSIDKNFRKTENLKVVVIDAPQKNAMCLPNGKIYITKQLMDILKNEEMLTFVVAHELAHYNHKDHLVSFKKQISNIALVFLAFIFVPDSDVFTNFVSNSLTIMDLAHSREAEYSADRYAGEILRYFYGDVDGGVEVLNTINNAKEDYNEILATHPNYKNRIYYLTK